MFKKVLWAAGIWLIFIGIGILLHLYIGEIPKKPITEDEGITYYYRNPRPDKLISILGSSLKQEKLINNPQNFKPVAHFFATAFQESRSRLEELKVLREKYSGGMGDAIERIIAETENFKPAQLNSAEDFELLWSEFKVTGKEEIIERIAEKLSPRDISAEGQLTKEAQKFLVKKAPHHIEIYHFLQKRLGSLSGWERNHIEEIINIIRYKAKMRAETYRDRGANYSNQGKYDKALKEYKKALNYFPDSSDVYVNLSNLYEKMQKREEALKAMEKAVEIDPHDPSANYGLGRHYSFSKRYDDAIRYYAKALEYLPEKPHYLHALARAYQEKGDKGNAALYFKKYLEVDPHGEHVHLVKQYLASVGNPVEEDPTDIVVMLQKKNFDSLEKTLSAFLRGRNKDGDGNSLLREAYRKLCEQPDAKYQFGKWIHYFNNWLRYNNSSHFANACMGNIHIDYAWHARGGGWGSTVTNEGRRLFRERLFAARDYLGKAYLLDPSDPIVPAMLITVAKGLGSNREEMEIQFQRAIKADSSEYEAYSNKLEYLMPKWYGTEDKMFAFAREAAKKAPSNSLIPLILAEAHWEMYRRSDDKAFYFKKAYIWKEMQEVYLGLCKSFPNSKRFRNLYAATAFLAGEHEIAREELKIIGNEWSVEAWGNKKYFEEAKKELFDFDSHKPKERS